MALSPGFQVTLSDASQQELPRTLTPPFPHLSVCIDVHNPHTAHSGIFVLVSDPPPPPPAYSKHNFLHVPNEGWRWRFGVWQIGTTERPQQCGLQSLKSKLMLPDFTASKQNAVQHLGQEQPPVRRDEHLPHHIHRQPEPADVRLKTGLFGGSGPCPAQGPPHNGCFTDSPLPAFQVCVVHIV